MRAWHRQPSGLLPDMWWHERAACRGHAADADVWFIVPAAVKTSSPQTRPEVLAALQFCTACPVRDLCAQQAAEDVNADGVWGGTYWPSDRSGRRRRLARHVRDDHD